MFPLKVKFKKGLDILQKQKQIFQISSLQLYCQSSPCLYIPSPTGTSMSFLCNFLATSSDKCLWILAFFLPLSSCKWKPHVFFPDLHPMPVKCKANPYLETMLRFPYGITWITTIVKYRHFHNFYDFSIYMLDAHPRHFYADCRLSLIHRERYQTYKPAPEWVHTPWPLCLEWTPQKVSGDVMCLSNMNWVKPRLVLCPWYMGCHINQRSYISQKSQPEIEMSCSEIK